jgi:regulator of RNase E activity RraA
VSVEADRLSKLSSSVVSDALERLGIKGAWAPEIAPLSLGMRVWGRAFTVKIGPHNASTRAHDEYMEDLRPGDVCVMDARGLEGAVWGDLRTMVAQRIGVAGTVVDGAVRDSAACAELGYPVFTRARTMLSGSGRVWIEAKQVPITIGGAYVRPGDLVLGDADGIVVLPQESAADLLAAAEELEAADARMREAIGEGMKLAEARKRYGAKKTLPAKEPSR